MSLPPQASPSDAGSGEDAAVPSAEQERLSCGEEGAGERSWGGGGEVFP